METRRRLFYVGIIVVIFLILLAVAYFFIIPAETVPEETVPEMEEIELTITHPVGISYNLEIDGKDHFGILYHGTVLGRKVKVEKKAEHTFQLLNTKAPLDKDVQWVESKSKVLLMHHQRKYTFSLEAVTPQSYPNRRCRVKFHDVPSGVVMKFTDANDKKYELTINNGEVQFEAAFHVKTYDDYNQTQRKLFMPFMLSNDRQVCEQAFLDVSAKKATNGNILEYIEEFPLPDGSIVPHHLYLCPDTNQPPPFGVRLIFKEIGTPVQKDLYYFVNGKYYEQPLKPASGKTAVSWWVVPLDPNAVNTLTLSDRYLGPVKAGVGTRNYSFATGDPVIRTIPYEPGDYVFYIKEI